MLTKSKGNALRSIKWNKIYKIIHRNYKNSDKTLKDTSNWLFNQNELLYQRRHMDYAKGNT